MPSACILIAASPNVAFYSQIAAMSRALEQLAWTRWEWEILVSFGGEPDGAVLPRWLPYLQSVDMSWVSARRLARLPDDWAQSDEVFRLAPRDVDVLLTMDADTLPVRPLEDLLDEVLRRNAVAGVIAHMSFPPRPGLRNRESWADVCAGLVDELPAFSHRYTLLDPARLPEAECVAPFYLNFGVVAFPARLFDGIATRYLELRPRLMERMHRNEFSGQVALTLAIHAAGAATWALPMRYNYPNDPAALALHPGELEQAVVFHYLRTAAFDRHRIFASADEYERFLALDLDGANRAFQDAVRRLLGERYPFAS